MTREARLLAVAASLGMLSAGPVFAIEPSAAPGAYCPFPEPGQKPACLAPVQERYPAFLEGADRGRIDEAVTAGVEADLTAASDTRDAYLALSSLAYAYYRLAQREAANPGADPALVRRLEHWNGLLSGLYHDADADRLDGNDVGDDQRGDEDGGDDHQPRAAPPACARICVLFAHAAATGARPGGIVNGGGPKLKVRTAS